MDEIDDDAIGNVRIMNGIGIALMVALAGLIVWLVWR